ncbi:hypothetical protein AB1N83_011948 [Pleurotus pulmonarius]
MNNENDEVRTPNSTETTSEELEPGTPPWFEAVIAPKLGYTTLKDFQKNISSTVFKGEDAVCIAPTGSGKSALLHIPLMAAKEVKGRVLGMSVAPTKALCDDQARAANNRGLKAIALYSDSIRAATANKHDLLDEIFSDEWDLFIVPPELLLHDKLDKFFRAQTNPESPMAKLDLVFINECHLVREHGEEFRKSYTRIGRLRHRLSSSIPWIAVTATLPPDEMTESVLQSLGFISGDYQMCRLRVDVPNIKYIPRFFHHSMSGATMLDISWIIPVGASPPSLKKTVVFCETIKLACRVVTFLESLLPAEMDHRDTVVMPFYSLLSNEYREVYLVAFRNSVTKILVGTDTLTCGMDVADVEQVVILGVPPSPERLSQQMGRAGRNGAPVRAVVYAQTWIQEKDEADKKGTKLEASEAERRHKTSQTLVHWFNASIEMCPRHVLCDHYGDEFILNDRCCILHTPEDNDEQEVGRWLPLLKKKRGQPGANVEDDGMHWSLDKTVMYPAAKCILARWTRQSWEKARGDDMMLPSAVFLPEHLQARLCSRMHLATTKDRLAELIPNWEYLETYGESLVKVCNTITSTFDEIWRMRDESMAVDPDAEAVDTISKRLVVKIPLKASGSSSGSEASSSDSYN